MEKYRHSQETRARQRGFTLTELVITMAILVILVAIGAPQLQTFIAQRAVSSQADTFAQAIRLARSEALKRGQRVTMCTSATPTAAIPVCSAAGSGNWRQGWVIWVDDGANARSYDSGETIIQVQQPFTLSGGIRNAGASAGQSVISFAQNGLALGDAAQFQVLSNLTGSQASLASNNRCVVLAFSGRIQINALSPSDCQP